MSVAEWPGTLVNWRQALGDLEQYVAPAFKRAEQRKTAGAFIDGLLSGAERKAGWMLAEEAGFERAFRIHSLLGCSFWSAERVNELVQRYTIDAPGDADGVLVIDETGFLKKGTRSVGLARQYSGMAGRIECAQAGAQHQLPDRRIRRLCQPFRSCARRSAALSAEGLGGRSGAAIEGLCSR